MVCRGSYDGKRWWVRRALKERTANRSAGIRSGDCSYRACVLTSILTSCPAFVFETAIHHVACADRLRCLQARAFQQ